MWPTIVGWIAGSRAAEELRMRRFKAEVDKCEQMQKLRSLYTPSYRSFAPDDRDEHSSRSTSRSTLRSSAPLDPYAPEALQLNFTNKYQTFGRRFPAPTCCPQVPGGHTIRRYMPWIQANHDRCQVKQPTPARHIRWADLPSPKDFAADDEASPSTASNASLRTDGEEAENETVKIASVADQVKEELDDDYDDDDDEPVTGKLELTCIGRFQHVSNVDLKWLQDKIEQEFHGPGAYSFFGTRMLSIEDHPLVQQYNKRRAEAIAAGMSVPAPLPLNTLEWSIANKIKDSVPKPEVFIDESGTEVHKGFVGPMSAKRSASYSNINTFSEWRFSNAETTFDTEATRLKEFGREGEDSVLKLVVADKCDPLIGTRAFIKANEQAVDGHERNVLNDRFAARLKHDEDAVKFGTEPSPSSWTRKAEELSTSPAKASVEALSNLPNKTSSKPSSKASSKATRRVSSKLSSRVSSKLSRKASTSSKASSQAPSCAIASYTDSEGGLVNTLINAKASKAPVQTTAITASAELLIDAIAGWQSRREDLAKNSRHATSVVVPAPPKREHHLAHALRTPANLRPHMGEAKVHG